MHPARAGRQIPYLKSFYQITYIILPNDLRYPSWESKHPHHVPYKYAGLPRPLRGGEGLTDGEEIGLGEAFSFFRVFRCS